MQPRRIVITLGTALGGLLAGAFFSAAVAVADDPSVPDIDVFGFTPVGTDTVDSTTGIPGLFQDYGGTQVFEVPDGGEFVGATDVTTTTFGGAGEQVIVTNQTVPDLNGDEPGIESGLPGAGSVYDIVTFDGFTNEYSDVLTGGTTAGGTVTDTLVTPSGTDIDLSWLFSEFPVAVAPTDALMSF